MKVFEVGLLVAALAILGASAIYSPFDYPSLWKGAASGFAIGSLATLTGFALALRHGGSKAFGMLGIFFLLKLALLATGCIVLSKISEWGDYRAYAFGFVGGFFLMALVASAFVLRASRKEVKHV